MSSETFRDEFVPYLNVIRTKLLDENDDLALRGLIDSRQSIYPVSSDTKLLSKVIELLLFPVIEEYAVTYGYRIQHAEVQNQYPDITLIHDSDTTNCIALDIKTTYRITPDRQGRLRVNGMTLGSYKGYFRTRHKPDKSTLAHDSYQKHFVLGLVSARKTLAAESKTVYQLEDLPSIPPVIGDIRVISSRKVSHCFRCAGEWQHEKHWLNEVFSRVSSGQRDFCRFGC